MSSFCTILFIPKGTPRTNRKTGNVIPSTKKGRLHVGYCLRDWCKVWYEPADDDDAPEGGQMISMYRYHPNPKFETSAAPGSKRREPQEGEIAWLPHFDPKHIQSSKPKEKNLFHNQTLYDIYRFLDEDDPEIIEELVTELTDVNHRRWQSLFEEAIKWKKTKMNAKQRRAERLKRTGSRPEDIRDEGDSAYETDSDGDALPAAPLGPMGPPPAPGRGAQAKRPSLFVGRGGPASKRSRLSSPSSSGTGRSSHIGRLPAQRRTAGQPAHVRGRPFRPMGQPFLEDSDGDGGAVMSGGNNHLPGSYIQSSRSGSADVIDGRDRGSAPPRASSEDWDSSPPEREPPQAQPGNEEGWVNTERWQKIDDEDVDGDEAFQRAIQRAMRNSVAPEEALRQPETEEEEQRDLERAMRASVAPPESRPAQPTQDEHKNEDGEED